MNKAPLRTAAFLLDLDGVLIQSHEAHLSSYQRALEDQGLSLSPRAEELIAMGTARDLVLTEAGVPERLLSSVSAAKEAAFLDLMLTGETVLTDGAIPFLRKLRDRQRKVALVSNSATAGACVRLLGLGWAFEEVVDGTLIQNPKPAPDGYRLAAELLNVSPSVCVSVEDSPTGATAARAAGTFVVGIGSRLQPAHVDSLFPNLQAIPLDDWLRRPSDSSNPQMPR